MAMTTRVKDARDATLRTAHDLLTKQPLSAKELASACGVSLVTGHALVKRLADMGAKFTIQHVRRGAGGGPWTAVYKIHEAIPNASLPRVNKQAKFSTTGLPFLAEVLEEDFMKPRGLTTRQLATQLDIGIEDAEGLVHGSLPLSTGLIEKLAGAFQTSPKFWLRLVK